VPRFDAHRLVLKLVLKCSNKTSTSQYFDWRLLGNEAGICFNALPERVTFLAGALDQEVTLKQKAVRKPREKQAVDQSEEVKPESVKNGKGQPDADKLSAMEKAMNTLRRRLAQRSQEELAKSTESTRNPEIDGVQFLFNPKSFTQTVENIFNFSFMIKKGEAAIGVRQNVLNGASTNDSSASPSGLCVSLRHSDPDGHVAPPPTQAVCCFTMRDWRNLIARQQLEKGDVPHRTGTKHGRSKLE
jgi:non-structural maintenance of chromosomes element 4